MYRRPKFLEILLEIRREIAHEADYDVDLYAEIMRTGRKPTHITMHSLGPEEKPLNGKGATRPAQEPKRSRRTRTR